MREMIQTERDYVKSLDYIIENYIPELMREDIPQALRGQRNVVFGNVEKIYEFHSQHFLRELEQCENNPLQVGQIFLKYDKKFYLYALYNKNKPKSDSLMSEYGSTFFKVNPSIAKEFRRTLQFSEQTAGAGGQNGLGQLPAEARPANGKVRPSSAAADEGLPFAAARRLREGDHRGRRPEAGRRNGALPAEARKRPFGDGFDQRMRREPQGARSPSAPERVSGLGRAKREEVVATGFLV